MESIECDILRPRQVRYQAALRPDSYLIINDGLIRDWRLSRAPPSHPRPKRPDGRAEAAVPPSALGYNRTARVMSNSRYALVAYIRQPVGQFVESLRRELHPITAHMAAHITILPPRPLRGSEEDALEFLEEACSRIVPFDVELGEVKTFLPTTPTVFIQVHGAQPLLALHDQLCSNGLHCQEEWPYVPHLTIVKTEEEGQAATRPRCRRNAGRASSERAPFASKS